MLRTLRKVYRWLPIIWRDQDFDWDFLAGILEHKMRNMAIHFAQLGVAQDSPRVAKQLLICAELLRRLRADDSSDVQFWQHEARMRGWERMLGREIGRHLRSWWD